MNFPRRIVGYYDVDRLQVEVWQHIEPRSTNHPFGLIPVFGIGNDKKSRKKAKKQSDRKNLHMDARERAVNGHEILGIGYWD